MRDKVWPDRYDHRHHSMQVVGETGASYYNFQLKSLFVKSMLDALFLSTHTARLLFEFIHCTIPLIFHIIRGTLLQQISCGSQSKCHSYVLLL